MTRTRHIGRTLLWGLACGWPLGASAAPLPELACAAGVHCMGTASAIGARARLGMDRNQAERAFVEASRDWPDTVWACAATASQCGHLSRDEARILIGLHDDAYGPAQRLRGAPPAAQSAAMQAPLVVAATNPSASGRGQRPAGIDVEVPRPGASEVVLVPPSKPGTDFQPRDGHWVFRFEGQPRASGGCLAGVAQAVAGQMPAPQSGQVVFARPFSGGQLIPSPQVQWSRVAANHWKARLKTSSAAMSMEYDLRVLSPERMEGASIVRVTVPQACTIQSPFVFTRQS